MEVYIIGQVIREFRTRFCISQEDLCDGLCAVSTLSRIENSQSVPSKKLAESLLSRMGITASLSDVPMNAVDMKRWLLERKIRDSVFGGNFEFKDSLDEYESLGDMDKLEEQSFLFYSAIYEFNHGFDMEKVLGKFEDALRCSIPSYERESIPTAQLLSNMELVILNNIALSKHKLGDDKTAILILEFLKNYYETRQMDRSLIAEGLPLIIFNLTNWKGLSGLYEEALSLAEQGIRVCSEYKCLLHYPFHIFNKAWSLCKLGRIKEGEWHFRNAFINLEYMGWHDEVEKYLPQVNSEFNLNLNISDFTCPKENFQ